MGFGPVRATLIFGYDCLISLEESPVWHIEAIWSGGGCGQVSNLIIEKRDLLVLDNSDPTGWLAVAGAKPDVVASGHANFNWKMGSDAMRVR